MRIHVSSESRSISFERIENVLAVLTTSDLGSADGARVRVSSAKVERIVEKAGKGKNYEEAATDNVKGTVSVRE